jgi:hypothetical protein
MTTEPPTYFPRNDDATPVPNTPSTTLEPSLFTITPSYTTPTNTTLPTSYRETTVTNWMTISAPTENNLNKVQSVNLNQIDEYISKKTDNSKISMINDETKKITLEMRNEDYKRIFVENNNMLMLGTLAVTALMIGIIVSF